MPRMTGTKKDRRLAATTSRRSSSGCCACKPCSRRRLPLLLLWGLPELSCSCRLWKLCRWSGRDLNGWAMGWFWGVLPRLRLLLSPEVDQATFQLGERISDQFGGHPLWFESVLLLLLLLSKLLLLRLLAA